MHGSAYEFGPFRLETSPRRLLRAGGTVVPLTPKALETLLVLVRNQGRLMTKRELMDQVWPGIHVEQIGLARNIAVLRKALGGDKTQRFIETWPRQGYRFVGPVTAIPDEDGRGGDSLPVLLAVLPFTHFGDAHGCDYLGLGIADALIGRLSQFRGIVVRPTNAVRLYGTRHQDPVGAGRALRVEYALDGCIQVADDRLRVTVQLIQVEGGGTLWAETYDERLADIFAIEDSIAKRLAEVLALRLTDRERLRLGRRPPDIEAHKMYLRGRYYWSRRTEESLRRAIECFNAAISADPTYALAYAGLADAHILLASFAYGTLRPADVWPRARAAALKALEFDDQLAEAHTSLAFIRFRFDWDWEGAERDFKHAIELNPNYATARHWYAYFLSTRARHEESLGEIRFAQSLDPLSPAIATGVGRFLYFAGRYDDAVAECRKALDIDSTFAGAHLDLGLIYEQLGRYDVALAEMQRAVALSGGSPVSLVHIGHLHGVSGRHDDARTVEAKLRRLSMQLYIAPSDWAVLYLGMGDTEKALDYLEQAFRERTSFMVLLNVEPLLSPLRIESRFQALLQRFA